MEIEGEDLLQIEFVMDITSEKVLELFGLNPIEFMDERFEFIINDVDLSEKYILFCLKEIQTLVFDITGERAQQAREFFNKRNSTLFN